jgi:hypothetical protein
LPLSSETVIVANAERVYRAEMMLRGRNAQTVPIIASTEEVTRRNQSRTRSPRLISFPKIFK